MTLRLTSEEHVSEFDKYQSTLLNVKEAHGKSAAGYASYWWNLYLIYRDGLWRCVTVKGKGFDDWLRELRSEEYAPSLQGFYNVKNALDAWRAHGKTDDEDLIDLLAKHASKKMALGRDLHDISYDKETGGLKPEYEQKLAERGEKPGQFLDRLAGLSSPEATDEVRSVRSETSFFFDKETCSIGEKEGIVQGVVVGKHSQKGVFGSWTITITAKPAERGSGKAPKELLEAMAKRLKMWK